MRDEDGCESQNQLIEKRRDIYLRGMKSSIFTSIFLLLSGAAFAIQPFDDLGRDNVTVEAKTQGGGSSLTQTYHDDLGGYIIDGNQHKEMAVHVSQMRQKKIPLVVEFYFAFKDVSGRVEVKKTGEYKMDDGEGDCEFDAEAHTHSEKWVYYTLPTEYYDSGNRISGWFVRAIGNDKILGIYASNPSFEDMAKDPARTPQ